MNTARQWILRIAGRLRIQRIIWDLKTGDVHLFFLIAEAPGSRDGLTNPLLSNKLWRRAFEDMRSLERIGGNFVWKVSDLFRVESATIADGVCMVVSFRGETKLCEEDARKMENRRHSIRSCSNIKLSFISEEITTNPSPAKKTMHG